MEALEDFHSYLRQFDIPCFYLDFPFKLCMGMFMQAKKKYLPLGSTCYHNISAAALEGKNSVLPTCLGMNFIDCIYLFFFE